MSRDNLYHLSTNPVLTFLKGGSMESYKNIIIAGMIAIALILSAVIIQSGIVKSAKVNTAEAYTLYGYEGALYRLNTTNGRLDVLVPSNEAALLFPIGQFQLPRADAKLTDQEKTSLSTNIRTIAQYIQGERARNLGISQDGAKPVKS